MKRLFFVAFSVLAAATLGACAAHDTKGDMSSDMAGMHHDATHAGANHAAVDLRNTVCPVTGDPVGDSAVVELYDGKVYHMCCNDCPEEFEKDPAKFAAKVAANPDKFGVKK